MSVKNVAIIGASGALGGPVLEVVARSGKFSKVFVFTRESSTHEFSYGDGTIKVNFDDASAIADAFRSNQIDAVVSCVGPEGLLGQSLVIDAAVAAGVKRFLPSEFGSDLDNPKAKNLPVFGYKVATQKYIEEKVTSNPNFTYTFVCNGPFLDWGINVGFLFDSSKGAPRIYDGGDQLFSATTLASIGQAVVGVLTHLEETANRTVYIEDVRVSQNQILEIAKRIAPSTTWEPFQVDLNNIKKAADEKLATGDQSVLYQYIFLSIFGDGYGGLFKKNDNALLGLPVDNKADEIIAGILKPLLAGKVAY